MKCENNCFCPSFTKIGEEKYNDKIVLEGWACNSCNEIYIKFVPKQQGGHMKGTKKEYNTLNKQWELRNTPGNNAIESEAEYRAKQERRTGWILKSIGLILWGIWVLLVFLIVKLKCLG
jgi:hypothetical protein